MLSLLINRFTIKYIFQWNVILQRLKDCDFRMLYKPLIWKCENRVWENRTGGYLIKKLVLISAAIWQRRLKNEHCLGFKLEHFSLPTVLNAWQIHMKLEESVGWIGNISDKCSCRSSLDSLIFVEIERGAVALVTITLGLQNWKGGDVWGPEWWETIPHFRRHTSGVINCNDERFINFLRWAKQNQTSRWNYGWLHKPE